MKHPDGVTQVLEDIEMDLRKGNIDFKQADAARAAALAVSYRLAPKMDVALAANAEMRAVIENACVVFENGGGMGHEVARLRAFLSRPDPGAGKVLVERELAVYVATCSARGYVHATSIDQAKALLDALLDKKGGG